MTKLYCDSPIHKVFCLALAFILLSFCVLPSFASADSVRPNEPVGWKDGDTFRDIIAVVLDSWGISFAGDSNSSNSLLEEMDDILSDFYADQNYLAEEFWSTANYGVNQLGQLILDYTTVGKIIQFAQWLISEYNLSNNSSINIRPSSPFANVNGYPMFFIPGGQSYTFNSYSGSGVLLQIVTLSPDYDSYFYQGHNNAANVFAVSPHVLTRVSVTVTNNKGFSGTYVLSLNGNLYSYGKVAEVGGWYDGLPYFDGSTSSPDVLLGNNPLVINGAVVREPLYINTGDINIPTLDDDEGLEVTIPGTNWGDSIYSILDLIERLIGLYDNTQLEIISIVDTLETLISNLQHSVTVENIPGAVILDYDEYDIPLENDWGLFDIFFNTGGDEITLLRPWQELRSIIYGFPAPVLSFFALVILFIVAYGFIRMGRDSH